MLRLRILAPALVLLVLWRPAPASAALTTFQTFTGHIGLSTDGFGSIDQSGTISASVPAGATVIHAYLYTSTYDNGTFSGVGGKLGGVNLSYVSLGNNGSALGLTAGRADVTSIVAPIVNGGAGGVYNFALTEKDDTQDGEALVVVYSLASLPTATVGIVDGYNALGANTTTINFGAPVNPATPGFFADMRLGIGYSCCGQGSTVGVNGTVITTKAGGDDDGVSGDYDGSLITMGGFDDAYSPFLPTSATDHERYNLVPRISLGDTSMQIVTTNPSGDDNIFLATFFLYGAAGINGPAQALGATADPVPEPGTMSLVALALSALGAKRRMFKG